MKAHITATLMLLWACGTCLAADMSEPFAPPDPPGASTSSLKPRAVFVQFGVADEANASTVGAIWNLWGKQPFARWEVYGEVSLSRWQVKDGHSAGTGVLTQVAAIPVVRYRFDEGRSPWFIEGGIGATDTSSLYRTSQKRFSTAFNFGDHLGWGYAFGTTRQHELALRVEHFSNASIKHPNPGENFVQVRYTHRFD
jgi:hypothetical protein